MKKVMSFGFFAQILNAKSEHIATENYPIETRNYGKALFDKLVKPSSKIIPTKQKPPLFAYNPHIIDISSVLGREL